MFPTLLSAALVVVLQDTITISLERAVDRAVAHSPAVAIAEGAVGIPRGERAELRWPFPENPSLEFGRVRRRTPTGTVIDRGLVLSQEMEIAGQGFIRAAAAGFRVRAAEARAADARRRVALEARRAFIALVVADRRVALTDSAATFAEALAATARRRMQLGVITQIDVNVAVLEAARQRSGARRARADRVAARADLRLLIGLGSDSTVRVADLPSIPALSVADVDRLALLALSRRPDVDAASYALEAAQRSQTAARLQWVPNLVLSGFLGREEGSDDLLGFAVGLRIPLFKNGKAPRGVAGAARVAAEAERDAVERVVQAEVAAAAARFASAYDAERAFADEVLASAGQNVDLTERALVEGKVGLPQVVFLRSAAVDAQLEYLEVLDDAYAGWFELAAALGTEASEVVDLLGGEAGQ